VIGRDVLAAAMPYMLAAGGVAAAGLWLRWALAPVAAAYRIGRLAGRRDRARQAGPDR